MGSNEMKNGTNNAHIIQLPVYLTFNTPDL